MASTPRSQFSLPSVELYSKASKIEESYHHIAILRRGPQPSYGAGGCHHDPNAMDYELWITSHYPQLNVLAICARIAASYTTRKAVLLGIILVTIMAA